MKKKKLNKQLNFCFLIVNTICTPQWYLQLYDLLPYDAMFDEGNIDNWYWEKFNE